MIDMKNKQNLLYFLILVLGFGCLFSSCGSVKLEQMVMMEFANNELDSLVKSPVLTIKTDDILRIDVASNNPDDLKPFQSSNTPMTRETSGEGVAGLYALEGYRVDESGQIYLPFIGGVLARGKSISELRSEVKESLTEYFPDITVNIRFLSFKITIMGEVKRPNVYTIPNERLTILEAIGMAGDFTDYAQRDNVLIIRERGDLREYVRLNTQDKNIFRNTYYYLNPGDIIYVAPLRAKQYATRGDFITRYGSFLFPLTSALTFILGITLR